MKARCALVLAGLTLAVATPTQAADEIKAAVDYMLSQVK